MISYRGLYLNEWWNGVWRVRIGMRWCGLRGHPWGEWMNEGADEYACPPLTRMCRRCDAYEQRDEEPGLSRRYSDG